MEEIRDRKFVPVTVRFDETGKMRPVEIEIDDENGYKTYKVDKVLDVRRAACQSAGGVGDRYTCLIRGQETYIWFDGRWWVALKRR